MRSSSVVEMNDSSGAYNKTKTKNTTIRLSDLERYGHHIRIDLHIDWYPSGSMSHSLTYADCTMPGICVT
jgi:hypothetical protein